MSSIRIRLFTGLTLLASLAVSAAARADAGTTFRKAYTGSSGGDNNFAAGYSLEYGFNTSKVSASARVGADAKGAAWVRLFGKTFDAVTVKGNASGSVSTASPGCTSSLGYEAYLVGIKAASSSITGGTYNKATDIFRRSQRLTPKIEISLVRIGPATLGLETYASATEYLRMTGTVWCNRISGELRPGANLSAVANFKADAVIVAAGIRGTLTLMDMSLPSTAAVGFSWQTQSDFFSGGTYCSWNGSLSASSKFEIIPISGKFEPWVRVGLPCTDIFGLLPGKGICLNKEWAHTLWSSSGSKSTFPLAGFTSTPVIGDGTSACPANPPAPPTRS